jgi:hypothetical protein
VVEAMKVDTALFTLLAAAPTWSTKHRGWMGVRVGVGRTGGRRVGAQGAGGRLMTVFLQLATLAVGHSGRRHGHADTRQAPVVLFACPCKSPQLLLLVTVTLMTFSWHPDVHAHNLWWRRCYPAAQFLSWHADPVSPYLQQVTGGQQSAATCPPSSQLP